jgi:RHS repeat-associated protein
VVKYKKNGTVFYTSTVTPAYPLRVGTSLWQTGGTLTNVIIAVSSSSSSNANIQWLVADQLGTPRIIIDKTGSLANVSRHDYLPFGEELFAGTGSRTTGQGYVADSVRQKFTSKERDNETGLDYFLARYYSSIQGRFTSPDNFDGNPFHLLNDTGQSSSLPYAILFDPQTLNAYSYVYNNPLSSVDHDGHQGGRKIQLPGKPRYQIRADIRNPNDAPNIHVFDKGGRREIGRVSIKPGGYEWDGKVPENVKAAVEKFITDKGIQPRLPGAQPRPGAASAEPEAGGIRVLRGTSNVISILAFITGAINEVQNQREAERNGYYTNYQGQIVITDLSKAAQNFPAHSAIDFGGHYWVPQGNTFVPLDNCDCTLEQDKAGKLHVLYKGD